VTGGITTVNPATGEDLEFYPYTTARQLDRILDTATASPWQRSSVGERVATIGRLGHLLTGRRERLARLISLEMGKPIRQARAEIDKCVGACRYYADRLPGFLEPESGPGAWFAPSIVAVTGDSVLLTDETFGPLGALTTGADDDELVAIANSSRYGLSSSLWSSDRDHAAAVGARIEAGAVFVNTISATDPRLPTGGVKASGHGRELGRWGVHELANLQALRIHDVRAGRWHRGAEVHA
jgi:acyl-CoA reductase-like NAD-dependent aldehyde dehydrogenase